MINAYIQSDHEDVMMWRRVPHYWLIANCAEIPHVIDRFPSQKAGNVEL